MGNCLITKLKAVVQNDSLPVFGELVFGFSAKNTNSLTIRTNNTTVIKVLDGTFSDDSTEVTISSQTTLNYVNASKFSINSKYNVIGFLLESTWPIDLTFDELKTMPLQSVKLRTDEPFTVQDTYCFDLIEYYQFVNCINFTGSTADFVNHPAKDRIQNILITESKITGTMDDFLSLPSLSSLNIRYCNIEVKRSTLNALQARGVYVVYSQTPIEDV